MFEQKLGKTIRVTDPDMIKKLRLIEGLDFEKTDGAVIVRKGTKAALTWSGKDVPGFRRPRCLDGMVGDTVRVWMPIISRADGELFRIEAPDMIARPRFTGTRMVIPMSYARAYLDRDLVSITFSSTTRAEFESGTLHAFMTKEKHPMCFALHRCPSGLMSNDLRSLVVMVKRFGFKLKQYVFISQNQEDFYFGQQNLQPVRRDPA